MITSLIRELFPRRSLTRTRTIRKAVRKSRSRTAYLTHKEAARTLVLSRVEHLNTHYGFTYGRIAIRDQRTRWGSCSKRSNLNFNYRLVFLPLPLVDLVIAHELCHLKEFHHGPAFWSLVAETIPDLAPRRSALRRTMISRLPAQPIIHS